MKKENMIFVIAQHFYGNGTGVTIRWDEVDAFLNGDLDCKADPGKEPSPDRRIVPVPGNEHIVIVYDQKQEDDYVNVKFPEDYARHGKEYKEQWGEELEMVVSCRIPEIDLLLHTRCIACRMDDQGPLQSLEEGDEETVMKYFL